jgi:glutamate synthase domain-containing protein 3
VAVVEGVGQHACEYMTGGTVVILGPVGHNIGAGMTGGEAFVHDPSGRLGGRLNRGLVDAVRPGTRDLARLRTLITRHVDLTGSEVAGGLLNRWADAGDIFWRIVPLREVARIEAAGETATGASA